MKKEQGLHLNSLQTAGRRPDAVLAGVEPTGSLAKKQMS